MSSTSIDGSVCDMQRATALPAGMSETSSTLPFGPQAPGTNPEEDPDGRFRAGRRDAAGGAAPFSRCCRRTATPAGPSGCKRASMVHSMLSRQGDVIDLAALSREVDAPGHRVAGSSTGLDDDTDHVEWLPAAKARINWQFWDRYRRYLEDTKLMPGQVVWRLDESTDRVLGQLENPERDGRWRRYGLVVGQVQSGKTGNYIGLACKAADAGYKLIVILAGIDNSLRSQTQLRVDEGFSDSTPSTSSATTRTQVVVHSASAPSPAPRAQGRISHHERRERVTSKRGRQEHQHSRRRLPGRPRDQETSPHP